MHLRQIRDSSEGMPAVCSKHLEHKASRHLDADLSRIQGKCMHETTVENSFAAYRCCELCPRHCRVDRSAGQTGKCGEPAECRIGSIGPHHGEEPPISGTKGSGTIFLSGCPCQCFFCQNYQLSLQHAGRAIGAEELLDSIRDLVQTGVHNLNFVTPDHFWPHIKHICRKLREAAVDIPFIYNCSGYERADLIPEVAEYMQIFLPDFKYSDPELARECSSAPEYPEVALAALREMVARRGFLEPFDQTGMRPAREGVLVRHLVLPGQADNSIEVLKTLREEFGRMLPLSVMSQYRPMPECRRRGLLMRQVTAEEYRRVCDAVDELGFRQVFLQPALDDTGYVPDFSQRNPFPGNSG